MLSTVNFKRLRIQNFLSIGNIPVEILFPVGLNAITGENLDLPERRNGIGKSTIADALHFALYGDTIRELKKDEIVNDVVKKKTSVFLEFEVVEGECKDEYIIERNLKPSKLSITKNGTDITHSTIGETDKFILSLIKTSKEVFQNRVIMTVNGTSPFMGKSKVDKRKFIEGILDLEYFSTLLKMSRDEYNTKSRERDLEELKIKEIETSIQALKTQEVEFTKGKTERLKDLEGRLNTAKGDLKVLEESLLKIEENSKEEFQSLAETLKAKEKEYVDRRGEMREEVLAIKAAKSQKIEVEKSIKKAEVSLKSNEDDLKELGDSDSVEEDRKKKQELEEKIEKLNEKLTELKEAKKELEKAQYKLEHSEIPAIEKEIEGLTKNPGTCEYCNKDIGEILINKNKKVVEELLAKKQGLDKKLTAAKEYVANHASDIKTSEEKISLNKNGVGIYERRITTWEANKKLRENLTKSIKSSTEEIEIEKVKLKKLEVQLANEDKTTEQFKTYSEKLDKVLERIELVDAEIKSIEKKENENLLKKKEISLLKKRLEELNGDYKTVEESKFSGGEDIKRAEVRMVSVNEKFNTLKRDLKIAEYAKFIFSEEGVKSFLIKKILGILNTNIAVYCKKMDAPCVVKFNEFFEDEITSVRGVPRSYWNFSGAERKSIDLAIMFAFIDLMKMTGKAYFNSLMFDELLDSSLDSKGVELVVNILKERVSKYGECIYVISHRKESLTYFDGDVVFLQKKNGITERVS